MSFKTKSTAMFAGLAIVVAASLTACGGGDVAKTGGDVAKTGADAAKAGADAAKAGADAAKAGADAMKAGADKAGADAAKAGADAAKAGADIAKAGASKVAGAALTPIVTPVKTALVQANTAIKGDKMDKAKEQFGKFESLWKTAEPQVKAAAGDKYPALEAGINKIKTVMGEASPKKEAASEAVTSVIKTLDSLTAGK